MSRIVRQDVGLALADGTAWRVAPGDDSAAPSVALLAELMRLPSCEADHPHKLLVVEKDRPAEIDEPGQTICRLTVPEDDRDRAIRRCVQISSVLCHHAQARGGLLLHGALAARDGAGVILAGPSGRGKTTAVGRLPRPWAALSDDATLVVRDPRGAWWAHPWPSWGSLLRGERGGSDATRAVPLKAICFLVRSPEVRLEPAGGARAAGMLVASAEQVWEVISHPIQTDWRTLRLQRFDNASELARDVPCFVLRLNLEDPFWPLIERAVGGELLAGAA